MSENLSGNRPSDPDDRTVHAEGDAIVVVRYEKAGKWWIESKPGRMYPAEQVPLSVAVRVAQNIVKAGGKVYLDRPGGGRFDAAYRRAGASPNCRSTSADSSVTRSEVSTNLNGNDPSEVQS